MATIASQADFSPSGGMLSCRVNDQDVEIPLTESGWTLLDVLRDGLGITSPKNGCQPQAQCGCCTVLMDGKPVLACALKAEKAEGKSITTLEGLDEEHRQQIAESFVRCGGVQCGFCIPGMAMRAVGLCNNGHEPSRDEIAQVAQAASVPLHRLPADRRQHRALQQGAARRAAAGGAGERPLGQESAPICRATTGHDAVLGDRKFIDDMTVPGMLYGAVRLADHPRATVLEIDAIGGARHAGRASRGDGGRRAGRAVRGAHRKRLAGVRGDRRGDALHGRRDRRRRGRHAAAGPRGGRADRREVRRESAGDRSARSAASRTRRWCIRSAARIC